MSSETTGQQSTGQDSTGQRYSPWLAVGGVCAVYFSFGLTIGVMAPLVDEISADLDLSRSTMGSILGAWALIYVFTAVPGGAVVDRLGLRWSLTIGGLSIATSALLRGTANGAPSLFAAVAIFGVGGPLVSIATPKLVASLFAEDERRLPTGVGVAAPALGSAVGLAITNPVLLPLVGGDWRGVMAIVGGVSMVATAIWFGASRAAAHVRPGDTRTDKTTLIRLVRIRSVQRVLAISLFSFFFSHGLSNWLPTLLEESGRSDAAAGYLAALSVSVGIAGSLFIARLVPSHLRPHGLVVIFVVMAATTIGLTTLPLVLVVASLGVLGFARAGTIPLLFLEIMGDDNLDVSDIGAATGLFFAVGEIGGFTGPYAAGYVADRTNGFAAVTVMFAIVALAAAAASMSLLRERSHRSGTSVDAGLLNGQRPASRLQMP